MAKKIKPINWNRIFANAGLSFFTSMTANIALGNMEAITTSAIIAIMYAGLAFFSEYKNECSDDGSTSNNVKKIISAGLIL